MPEFHARPEAIQSFATLVEGLATGTSAARTYLSTWTAVSGSEDGVIFFNFAAAARGLVAGADQSLDRLGVVLGESAAELGGTAVSYESTDSARAVDLNLTYPGAP